MIKTTRKRLAHNTPSISTMSVTRMNENALPRFIHAKESRIKKRIKMPVQPQDFDA